ncbi:MAG: gamma-glutamyl-gamma-aminobutyrate hydrolase family protein [Chloroflexota bacterium]
MIDASGRRPLIGITVGPGEAGGAFLSQRATYPRCIEAAGGLPVFIPPLGRAALEALLERLDGVLLPGGADVDPSLYGHARGPRTDVIKELDEHEMAVVAWALRTQTPTLGICRGQQVLNVALGGTLRQHIDAHRQAADRSALTQPVRIAAGSRLATVMGTTYTGVNHMHHQAVDSPGKGLAIVARAEDGTIEGLEYDPERHPWMLMVQYHPEELVGAHEPSRRLLEAFVQACAAHARERASADPGVDCREPVVL